MTKDKQSDIMKSLVSDETKKVILEYFNSTKTNRQKEVQEFLLWRLGEEKLVECINNPKKGRQLIRQSYPERFYWWSDEDVENVFRNWE